MSKEITFDEIMEIEDFLQSFKANCGERVFHKMSDSTVQAHTDSYGTILSYAAFDEALKASNFSKDKWRQACSYWLENDCAGKPLKMIAHFLNRTFLL